MKNKLKKNWGRILLFLILSVIIILNFKPGYFILGNDNYSPELNPGLSVDRFLENPAWRSYRVVGVASDADQADLPRALLYLGLSKFLPLWLISQSYIFLCLISGVFSCAHLTSFLLQKITKTKQKQLIFLFSGLIYLSSLLTLWIFFSPLNAFMAAYAFLPLLLYCLLIFLKNFQAKNGLWLLLSSLALSTSAIVPTTFIVGIGIILLFLLFFSLLLFQKLSLKQKLLHSLAAFLIIITPHLSWILPFAVYAKTNSQALQESYINRMLTPNFLESEIKYNTPLNTLKYYFSWIEVKNNDGTNVYPFKNWYQSSKPSLILGLIPLLLSFTGLIFIIIKRCWFYLFFPFLTLTGFFLIKGINPPAGFIYQFLQQHLPLFKQVFRWQSSKLWPFLSLSLPLLATLGLLFFSQLKISLLFKKILLIILSLSLLYYIHPAFTGHLIQEKNYTKIPPSYFSLTQYLEKNDSHSRIYLAPEANNLYFRYYQWGFWGSSFLNYLLPNPLIEKALTTGSLESENAQAVIEAAYYSENPLAFTQALNRFNTPYVLSDKSVTNKKDHYLYDWSAHQTVISQNPHLTLVWQEDDLALYHLSPQEPDSDSVTPLSSQHHFKKLNQILAFQNNPLPYFNQAGLSGDIYPLALDYRQIDFSPQEITLTTTYQDPPADYSFYYQPSLYLQSPTSINYQKETSLLTFSPSTPKILINNQNIAPPSLILDQQKFSQPLSFLTVDRTVLDLRQNQKNYTIENNYQSLQGKNVLSAWTNDSINTSLIFNSSQNPHFTAPKDSILELTIQTNAPQETQINLCIWSETQLACLSPNISASISQGSQTSTILVPKLIPAKEKITIFVEPKGRLNLDQLNVKLFAKLYQNKQVLSLAKKPITLILQSTSISLKPNDTISLVLPKIHGSNSFHLQPEPPFMPEFSNHDCSNQNYLYPSKSTIKTNQNQLIFSVANCHGGIYSKLYRLHPHHHLAAIFYQAVNTTGIPLDIALKTDKNQYPIYKNRLYPQSPTQKMEYILLPQEQKSYLLDIFSQGIGPRTSQNTLSNLSIQFIPPAWLDLRLKNLNSKSVPLNKIQTVPEAVSPSWQSKDQQAIPIRLNGWQQAWLKNQEKKAEIIFWPDNLAYFGYTSTSLLLIYLIAKSLKSKKESNR